MNGHFENIKNNIRFKFEEIALAQANDADMVKFWHREAEKKEVILDACRKIIKMQANNNAVDKYYMIQEVIGMIPKGITMGSLV